MIKKVIFPGILLLSMCGFHWWDPLAKWIGIGNEAFREGKFEEAQKAFQEAEKISPSSSEVYHNMGAVNYKQEKFEDAESQFKRAMAAQDPELKAKALYNLGCTQLGAKQPSQALESFQKALMIKPDDEDSKINLELTKQMLQMQTPTPQSQEKQDQQDQKNQDQQQQQTPPPEQTANQTTPTPSETSSSSQAAAQTPTPAASPTAQQEQAQAEPQSQQTPPQEQEGEMSPEEAKRLLDALEEEEMEVLKRFHQLPEVEERKIEKDW